MANEVVKVNRISEMEIGSRIEGFFILDSADIKTTKDGKVYLAGNLMDKDSKIPFKIWDYNGTIHELVGKPIKVRGTVSLYQNKKALTISQYRPPDHKEDQFDITLLVPKAPTDNSKDIADLEKIIGWIKDPDYSKIVTYLYNQNKTVLTSMPAAKSMHHAFYGGLIMHTLSVANLCMLVSMDTRQYVNADLLLSGAILHDIAKCKEYDLTGLNLVSDLSTDGVLFGHLVMGVEMVDDAAKASGIDPNCEKVKLLKHLLASHHGQPEFGAAVTPRILEAEILSQMDMLDAKAEAFIEAMDKLEPGTISEPIRALDGRRIYKHTLLGEPEKSETD